MRISLNEWRLSTVEFTVMMCHTTSSNECKMMYRKCMCKRDQVTHLFIVFFSLPVFTWCHCSSFIALAMLAL